MFNIIIIKIITFIYRHLSRHSRTQLNSKITVCIKLENTIELKVNASTEQATFKRCVLILALKDKEKKYNPDRSMVCFKSVEKPDYL